MNMPRRGTCAPKEYVCPEGVSLGVQHDISGYEIAACAVTLNVVKSLVLNTDMRLMQSPAEHYLSLDYSIFRRINLLIQLLYAVMHTEPRLFSLHIFSRI